MTENYNKKPSRIMVIGGTVDSRVIISELLKRDIAVIATVATSYGESLLSETPGLSIIQEKMDVARMIEVITEMGISCVIDASHPFAANVSVTAMDASSKAGVCYIRFERESHIDDYPDVYIAENFEEAAIIASKFEGNIFLTTGSNSLDVFVKHVTGFKERLFTRVLPVSNVILKCENLGLSADNIIAMKGPFSKELNMAMLRHCKATVLVTKESGEAGGVFEKIQSAREIGIQIILIKRPNIKYENIYCDIGKIINYVIKMRN